MLWFYSYDPMSYFVQLQETKQAVDIIEPRAEVDAKRPETHKEQSVKGLKNIGNTCYMNAALQVLSNTPPFAKYLLDCGAQLILSLENENHPMKVTRAVCDLLEYLWNTDENAYFRPSRLLRPVKQMRTSAHDAGLQLKQASKRTETDQ
ncbi:ubiquitin carboxyl-terminal hydrolase 33-like [Nilaparvata lugens]|uniref:ubiquitin carboxyl-terminal hydrolase 33-like n=1 Tax=Nilaparvata lugens TaxID=108931 RepID=UPI00193DBC4A|nr:ubiquitin carboxyl-terminal hydrolase 33-like [Nilaparvata lugens]